jgi:hypothetical protein
MSDWEGYHRAQTGVFEEEVILSFETYSILSCGSFLGPNFPNS